MTAPDTHQKIPLTIRLDKWLHDKLEAAAGQKTKNEYIKEILIAHLDAPDTHQTYTTPAPTSPPPEILKALELKRGSTNVAVTEGHGEFPVAKVKDGFIS